MNISISTLVIMAVVFIVLILSIVLLAGKVVAYHKAYEDLLNRSKNYLNLSKNCNKTSETIIQQNKDLLNEREMYRAQLRSLTTSAEQLHQDNFKLRKEIREVKDINKKLVSSDSCIWDCWIIGNSSDEPFVSDMKVQVLQIPQPPLQVTY